MPEILAAPVFISTSLTEDPVDDHDFTRFDGYLGSLPVLYLPGEQRKVTATLDPQPPRTDIGASEFETRSEFGDFFAQGDFSHGAGQRFFHRPGRDEKQYLYSEGFDITDPGRLTHLNDVSKAGASAIASSPGPTGFAEVGGELFIIDGNRIERGSGSLPGSYTTEDPHVAEGDETVEAICASGAELYAALGANGVHVRPSSGTWEHFQPDAATDLDVGTATLVRWLKDRLMVVGDAGRGIYEVIADSSPTAIETLPEGWVFTEMFEGGQYIFATAVNEDAGLSRVHAYGLDSAATSIEKKTSTPMPKGDLAYSGCSAAGRIFIGGGRILSSGKNGFLYEAGVNDTGELQLLLRVIDTSDIGSDDCSVKCFEVLGDKIVFGWTSARFEDRTGVAAFHLGRNAFFHHLWLKNVTTLEIVRDVHTHRGRLVIAVDSTSGFFYEETNQPVPEATLVTSMADWNTASQKTWDLFEVTHDELVVNTSVELEYTKTDPDLELWEEGLVSNLPGSIGASTRIEDTRSRRMAVRLKSTASDTDAPVIQSFSVRSTPSPDTEWQLVRTVRIFERDRKNGRAEPVNQDPREIRTDVQDLARRWVTLYEPGVTWTAYVKDVAEVEPGQSEISATLGESEKEAYYMELRMIGRRA